MNEKDAIKIASFSGGKDSTAMLLLLLERGEIPDYVLHCLTGAEYPEIEAHVKKFDLYLHKFGLKITYLRAKKLLREMIRHVNKNGELRGFPAVRYRWCTSVLKTRPIKEFIRRKLNRPLIMYVGYNALESKRVLRQMEKNNFNITYKFPLYDMKISGKEALAICERYGFDFGGIYEHMSRVSCYYCPYQTSSDIRYLCKHRPELWNNIKEDERYLRQHGKKFWRLFNYKGAPRSTDEIEKLIEKEDEKIKII